jgi:hypothetical protein
VGLFTKTTINHVSNTDLEGINSHIVVIDTIGNKTLRIIKVYRCFNPIDNLSGRALFRTQQNIIKQAYTDNCILLEDFDLNGSTVHFAFQDKL